MILYEFVPHGRTNQSPVFSKDFLVRTSTTRDQMVQDRSDRVIVAHSGMKAMAGVAPCL